MYLSKLHIIWGFPHLALQLESSLSPKLPNRNINTAQQLRYCPASPRSTMSASSSSATEFSPYVIKQLFILSRTRHRDAKCILRANIIFRSMQIRGTNSSNIDIPIPSTIRSTLASLVECSVNIFFAIVLHGEIVRSSPRRHIVLCWHHCCELLFEPVLYWYCVGTCFG
jgi:hypothetical protein